MLQHKATDIFSLYKCRAIVLERRIHRTNLAKDCLLAIWDLGSTLVGTNL